MSVGMEGHRKFSTDRGPESRRHGKEGDGRLERQAVEAGEREMKLSRKSAAYWGQWGIFVYSQPLKREYVCSLQRSDT